VKRSTLPWAKRQQILPNTDIASGRPIATLRVENRFGNQPAKGGRINTRHEPVTPRIILRLP
jgi:hypothetical protein